MDIYTISCLLVLQTTMRWKYWYTLLCLTTVCRLSLEKEWLEKGIGIVSFATLPSVEVVPI